MILSPSAIDADHRGRLGLRSNELSQAGNKREEGAHLILEDTDGDNKADR